jgi:hypothetical protein
VAVRYDVAARLAEGLAAVDDMQVYVEACRMRGYQHPDLTPHGARIRDRYAAEEGLDLGMLETDCATLRDMSLDSEEGLRQARSQISALTEAWTGGGGVAAADFVRRHCDSAAVVGEALRAAAVAWGVLRDDLWQVVDRRVATTLSTVEPAHAQRSVWLAAARSVLGGDTAGDDATEIVDGQVKPFVDSAIRRDWVSAMQAADGAAAAAYRRAIGTVGGMAGVRFEVPGDLGPRYRSSPGPGPVAEPRTAADSAVPSAASAPDVDDWPTSSENLFGPVPPYVPASVPPGVPPASAPAPANPLDAWATLPAPSSMSTPPGLGAGSIPGLGAGNVPGLGAAASVPGRFVDALSGLLGTPTTDAVPDLSAMPDPGMVPVATPDVPQSDIEPQTPDAQDPPDKDTEDTDPEDKDGVGHGPDAEDPAGEDPDDDNAQPDQADADTAADDGPEPIASSPETDGGAASAEPPDPTPAEAAPMPPLPVTAEPPASGSPGPAVGDATPCEIAADELPQAGQ